ncbi:MAG: nitrite reductase large subunit NirB [Angustibacter sp.]
MTSPVLASTRPQAAAPTGGAGPRQLVVIGAGMVAHRLVETLLQRLDESRPDGSAGEPDWQVTVIGEETDLPYDRVALTSHLTGRSADELVLGEPVMWQDPRVTLRRGEQVVAIDRDARTVSTDERTVSYDALTLATGSSAFVPPVPGRELAGCFVYRTLRDVAQLRAHVQAAQSTRERGSGADAHDSEMADSTTQAREVTGVVVGGGLLGLEAAGALQALGVRTHVVEFAPRLMPLQVDDGGGAVLRRRVQELGVSVHTGTSLSRVLPGPGDCASRVELAASAPSGPTPGDAPAAGLDPMVLDVDLVVFAAGIRPRDELARAAGLDVGDRGGVLVDDGCQTADPAVWAVGEVACIGGRTLGLVAPGYAMAEVVADRLLGGDATFGEPDLSTKLKLLGVDVASFGDAMGASPRALDVVLADPVGGVYRKLVLSDDARTLLGGVLVGDAAGYPMLRPMLGRELSGEPASWVAPSEGGSPGAAGHAAADLPDDATVCSCNAVAAGAVRDAVRSGGCTDLAMVKACTRAGTSCGSCVPLVGSIVRAELTAAGVEVARGMCEHFEVTRAELFDIVRVTGISTFSELVARHGRGRGCDVCKPVVASILASLGAGHVLDGGRGALQDTNDHVMANLQRDGTYSVVPRIPGGEVSPEGLIAIGEVAREFELYTKITGGQRIDLFGARIEQLPAIWQRLVDAGFESGHAYGKALRTVKSCVGSTWCRYGVQDSVALAVALELRYRGLRAPHKLKLGVSGCARECAEARSKDVGVIATDTGWDVYVGGNGGFTPRHAQLLASSLDTATLVRTIDRFLVYYVRTADRLQRTAAWLEQLEGGLDHLRGVVLDDTLGIAADLDAAIVAHVDGYQDEWRATLEDPAKLRRFAAFVNAPDTADPDLVDVDGHPRRPVRAVLGAASGFVAGATEARSSGAGNTAETVTGDDGLAPTADAAPMPAPVVIAGPRLEVASR